MYNSNNKESVEIGNTNNENYNFENALYQPTQFTQVVFGKPKIAKSRKARPPTKEELAIKHRILDVWTRAQYETGDRSVHLQHLGRILDALNPKYISTQRVRDVAFADPNNPDVQVTPPEWEHSDQIAAYAKDDDGKSRPALEPLKLVGTIDTSSEMIERLGELEAHFKKFVDWDVDFVESLMKTDDRLLNPVQIAFKHLINTLSQAHFASQLLSTFRNRLRTPAKPYVAQARDPSPAMATAPVVKAPSPSATVPMHQPIGPYTNPPVQQTQAQLQPQLQQQQPRPIKQRTRTHIPRFAPMSKA